MQFFFIYVLTFFGIGGIIKIGNEGTTKIPILLLYIMEDMHMSKNGNLDKKDNVVIAVEKNVNGIEKGKMAFCGEIVNFSSKGEIDIEGNNIKLLFKELTSKLKNVRNWNYDIDGFKFVTYNGIDDNDSFTDISKDGKPFITNLGFQSLKRIAESKKWNISKMHNEYLVSVGRIAEKNSVTIKGKM